jgi:hypothetical protein
LGAQANRVSINDQHRNRQAGFERRAGARACAISIRQQDTEPARRIGASRKENLRARGLRGNTGENQMTYQDIYQQSSWQNPMQWSGNPHQMSGLNLGLGQAAYGFQQGPYGMGQQFGGAWGSPSQQRQLSPLDVSEVVRQMVPLLPQILAQSQQQPLAAFGYGINQRQLSPQDINEVVRQLLPILPQIINAIQQGQTPMHAVHGGFGQGGFGQSLGWQNPYAQQAQYGQGYGQGFGQGFGNPYGQFGPQAQFGQFGSPFQAAFGGLQNWGQRQLSPQDVNDVVRQLVTTIPQVIGNLQAYGQRLN